MHAAEFARIPLQLDGAPLDLASRSRILADNDSLSGLRPVQSLLGVRIVGEEL